MSAAHQQLALVAGWGSAVAAGSLFVFSSFVGRALAESPDAQAVPVMQRINVEAPRSPVFMAVLFLPALLAVVALLAGARGDAGRGSVVLLGVAATLLVVGVVGLTVAFHVPRNDALALHDLALHDLGRGDVGQSWTGWPGWWRAWRWGNHVRTISAAGASACLLLTASR